MRAANESAEPVARAGPLCDVHREQLTAGQDWEPHPGGGEAEPAILMGDSLLALDQYILLETPSAILRRQTIGDHIPLRVRRRGETRERELTLVIPPHLLPGVTQFFQQLLELYANDE